MKHDTDVNFSYNTNGITTYKCIKLTGTLFIKYYMLNVKFQFLKKCQF